METFRQWGIPQVPDLESKIMDEQATQDNLCDCALCEDERFDCGTCLFSTSHCPLVDFNEWKQNKIETIRNDE